MKKLLFPLLAALALTAVAQTQPHVYINPGHGGHDSDDRNVVVYPFERGDTNGFWESNSNLKKGIALNNILRAKGYKTSISRQANTTDDDLPLSTIVYLCNHSGADAFYAIHSNATGTEYRSNYPMGIYRGYTGQPQTFDSDRLTATLAPHIVGNEATYWTSKNYYIYGDWTFYPSWGTQGLGVLRGNNVPSMLDEGSFHDYIPEAYRLLNNNYCWFEGWNFSLGADDFFGRASLFDKGSIMGNLRDSRRVREVDFIVYGDDKRQPVHNGEVRLETLDGEMVDFCYTDELYNGIYVFKFVAPGKYRIVASSPEHYEMVKEVEVKANKSTYCNFDLNRIRNTPPEVVSHSPVWSDGDAPVPCNAPVVLDFNWDMDNLATEAAFSIQPPVDGEITWQDSFHRLVFTPTDAYDVNTLYTVTLTTGAKHGAGVAMEQDFTMQFLTQGRNHLEVLAAFPHDNDRVHYKSAIMEFRTDSLLTVANYFDHLLVTDSKGEQVALNKRSAKLNKKGDAFGYLRLPLASELTPGEEYTLTVTMELTDTTGLHLTQPLVNKFTAVDVSHDGEGASLVAAMEAKEDLAAQNLPTTSKATITAVADCMAGSKAVQVKYEIGEDDDFVLALAQPAQQTLTSSDELGVYVHGDFGMNRLVALLATASNDVKEVDMGTINFHGWRFITASLAAMPAGEPCTLQGFKLVRHDNKMGATGTIKIDDVMKRTAAMQGDVDGNGIVNGSDVTALYNRLLNEVVPAGDADVDRNGTINGSDVTALYNLLLGTAAQQVAAKLVQSTVSDYVVASADSFVVGMELIDAQGHVVARNGGNFINVKEIPAGSYVVKIHTPAGTASRHVTVVH